jgi:hypothetical protein
MGYKPVQRGAMTDRRRRFCGVTGGGTGSGDETIAPVAIVADLTQSPYSTGQEHFCVTRQQVAAGGEARFRVGIGNQSGSFVVVDSLLIYGTKAMQIRLGGDNLGFGVLARGYSRDFTTLNQGGWETGPSLNPRLVPVVSFFNIAGIADGAPVILLLQPNILYQIPLGWTMAPDQWLYAMLPGAAAASDSITFTAFGRIIQDPTLSVQG